MMMKIAFEEEAAYKFNQEVFETIYHAAMEASMEISKEEGPYSTFKGSPLSEGLFQFDLWKEAPPTQRYDWAKLREQVM